MVSTASIVIADSDASQRAWIRGILREKGYLIVGEAETRETLEGLIQQHRPDVVIAEFHLAEIEAPRAAKITNKENPHALITTAADLTDKLSEQIANSHAAAFLKQPFQRDDLIIAVQLAVARRDELQSLQFEADDLRQALADRKIVERAKGVLMKVAKLDEPSAYRRMQDLAQKQNKTLVQIADLVLVGIQALDADTSSSR